MKARAQRKREQEAEEEYFQVQRYQEFSREAIVFFKRVGDLYVKWTVMAGNAFQR